MVRLPDYKKITIRNEVDRYGFSYLLANSMSRSHVPRSFCNWVHGWIWWSPESDYDLGCHNLPKDNSIVVVKKEQKILLDSLGYTKVYIDCLPFARTTSTGITRKVNSLLSFLPHVGDDHPLEQSFINNYLDYLVTVKESFDEVFVCVFWAKGNEKSLLDDITKRGLKYVLGANPLDANALIRMRKLLDYFDYVTTSDIGSHIVYAAYTGCKVSICGPYHSRYYAGNSMKVEHEPQEYFDRMMKVSSFDWVKNNFSFLFCRHPKDAVEHVSWAKIEMGEKNLTNDELVNILGWSLNSQIKGYFRGLKNRIIGHL